MNNADRWDSAPVECSGTFTTGCLGVYRVWGLDRQNGNPGVLGFVASQPRCVVAMEACASAHHWGREIDKLGHVVRLVPPIWSSLFQAVEFTGLECFGNA